MLLLQFFQSDKKKNYLLKKGLVKILEAYKVEKIYKLTVMDSELEEEDRYKPTECV